MPSIPTSPRSTAFTAKLTVRRRRELAPPDTKPRKLAAIKSTFETWVWQDSERADRLVRIYNDAYNNLVTRTFNGRHLTLPGASTTIQMRDHQKRVVWRIVAAGSTLCRP